MILAELSLSTNTLFVLNPSMANMMTRGSLCGRLILLASHLEKMTSSVICTMTLRHWLSHVDAVDLSLVNGPLVII